MRQVSQGLATHLEQSETTLCSCWILRRLDGHAMGFTDHDRALVLDDVQCEPDSGMDRGTVQSTEGLAGDTSQLSGALSSDQITDRDIQAGRYDGAIIEHYLVNWNDVDSALLLSRGRVGEITQNGKAFNVELRSFAADIDRNHGRLYIRSCDADLGDGRCKVDLSLAEFHSDGVVDGGLGPTNFLASGLNDFQPGWYDEGKLTWLSGENSGLSVNVRSAVRQSNELDEISLFDHVRVQVSIGDTFHLQAGCDKSFATCKAKFNNGLNFRGFPHIPGNDRALNYADGEGMFDGQPLVP